METESRYGHLDILIDNAGICPTEFSRSILREALKTNAISPAMVTQAFAPLLKSSAPRIIYVPSTLGSVTLRGNPEDIAYNEDYKAYRTSKAPLNMLASCNP